MSELNKSLAVDEHFQEDWLNMRPQTVIDSHFQKTVSLLLVDRTSEDTANLILDLLFRESEDFLKE